MKRLAHLLLLTSLVASACSFEKDYNPDKHLTVQQQDLLMERIIRYAGHSPDGITVADRFNKQFDTFYEEERRKHRLDALYTDGDGYYFLISRGAPSLKIKSVAIGGKLRADNELRVTYYEEVFRTWKMEPDTLLHRSLFLFDKMVKGEDLSPYYSSRSGNTDYIEFPDDRTYFDTQQRIWRTR